MRLNRTFDSGDSRVVGSKFSVLLHFEAWDGTQPGGLSNRYCSFQHLMGAGVYTFPRSGDRNLV